MHYSELKINTELNVIEKDDGSLLVHLPIRGHAFRAGPVSRALLDKLSNRESLTAKEASNPLVNELKRIGALGGEIHPLPTTKKLDKFEPVE
jgi:hypothetical protein